MFLVFDVNCPQQYWEHKLKLKSQKQDFIDKSRFRLGQQWTVSSR
jgi:hypothetical protein